MNIFLVGNGFDLHHKFPTHYIDFLHTMQFLMENYDESMTTVGDIFGNKSLQEKNSFIKDCYEQHAVVYGSTTIKAEVIKSMVSRANENIWFSYFCNCVSKDIHWIDFENEISRVLEAFKAFFDYENELTLSGNHVVFDISSFPSNIEDRYILGQFDFFFEDFDEYSIGRSRFMCLKDEYVNEKVVGSNSFYPAENDIVSELFFHLRELAELLREYLLYFVDGPARACSQLGRIPRFINLPSPDRVYSFNYTNTLEIFYKSKDVNHIHGNTETNIVLGINPDETDDVYTVDTTFLQFKKYFQRVLLNTDESYLKRMIALSRVPRGYDDTLYVIGHSLDSTDEDIIKQIFASVNSIKILYHSDTSVKSLIKNLVQIYGKEGLDQLREKKSLQFIPQTEIQWSEK